MLELRRNRMDYTGELLCPPEGYRFERAVATTYSLDLETLLAVLLPLAFGNSTDTPEVLHCQPLLLQALNRVGSRLTVFHQVGQIPVPKRESPLYALLDRILVPMKLEQVGNVYPSFHPKTWTIEYRNDVGEVHYRFVVLSRNLTFDRSLDVAILLESGADRRRTRATRPLCAFLDYLADHVAEDLPHKSKSQHVQRVESIANGLATHPLTLESDKTWNGFEILPLLGDGLLDEPLFSDDKPPWRKSPDRVVAVSPFLSDRVVAQMAGRVRKDEKDATMTLVTRPDVWASLSPASRRGIEAWALKDKVALPEVLSGEVDEGMDEEVSRVADLHAKLYCWQRPRETCLLLGSMNATESGLHRNVELLVRLWGNPRSYGCETLRKELFGKVPGLNPFERLRDDATLSPSEKLKEETNRDLQEIVQLFCRCGGKGRVECDDGGHWELVVDIPQDFLPPTEIHCSLRPMASKPESARPVRGTLRFGGLREADLSPLFVFSAEKAKCRIQRVVHVPVKGIHEETRDKAVADAAIEAGGGWANALALLFSDEPYYTAAEQFRRRGDGRERTGGLHLPPGLYEKMLLVVAAPDGRERFAEAESLIARYAGEEAQRVKDLLKVFRKALGHGSGRR